MDRVNARIGWTPASGTWELALWAKNLLNEAEVMNVGPQFFLSQRPAVYGAPRTFGTTFQIYF